MAEYEVHSEVKVGVHTSFKAVYSEATYKRIEEAIIFFRTRAVEEDGIDDRDKKRYTRIVILLIVLYLESLSNLIFEELVTKDLDDVDKRTDLPKPIRRFRAVHYVCLGKELTLSTDGIQDIFTIRNKIFVHPAGRAQSQTSTGKDGWSPIDEAIDYKKFKHFPLHYSHFTVDHTDELLKEANDFRPDFSKCLGTRYPPSKLVSGGPGS